MAASTERTKDPYEMGFLLAPRVPQGLAAVVESLTREVLRQRPEDIYVFAARHFEKLLRLREQYDVVDKKPNKEYNNFSNTIKKRNDCKESRKSKRTTKDIGGCTRNKEGWSLNETARVLERHRNIFGDGEKRISTEEVRALAKEKNLRTSSSSIGTKTKRGKRRTSDTSEEYSKDNLKTITDNNDSSKLDRSSKTLKIISQIPTVLTRNTGTKDIKMELRKNRLSGSLREKSTDSSNDGQYQEQISDISRKSSSSKTEFTPSIENLEEERIEKRTTRRSESVERNSNRSSRSRKRKDSFTELLPDKKELSKTRSMDQVKEYVVRTFGSIKNIDQLDTSYVNQVQNVIDRTIPIIKDKVDELKNDVLSKKSNVSSLNTDSLKKRETRPNTSENDTRSNDEREKYHSKRSSSADSTDFRRQQDDTLENRLINTQNILEGIISSKCYTKSSNINYNRSKSNNGYSNEHENRYSILDENSKIILPAVRPASSKNSKCLSRSDSNHLILPPISPDTGKISKKKDDMTLPTLSTITVDTSVSSSSLRLEEKENNSVDDKKDDNLGDDILQLSTSIKEDISSTRKMLENVNEVLKAPVTSIDNNKMIEQMSSTRDSTRNDDQVEDFVQQTNDNLNEILGEQILEIEEICKDSLNVTPDIIDIPPSPDSLEPVIENHRLSTVEEETELKDKFLQIEEIKSNVDKVIEDSLEDSIDKDEVKNPEPVIVEVSDDSIVVKPEEPVKDIVEIIKVTQKSNDDKSRKYKPEDESDNVEILQVIITNDDKSTERMENDESEINKSENEMKNIKDINETVSDEEIINEQEHSSLSSKENKIMNNSLHISLSKEVPFSYILTEGSPVEIPDFVTTVIIPERSPSRSEFNLDNNEEEEEEEENELCEERRKRAVESFGEYIRPEQIECSTVDIDFIRGIKAGHDIAINRQDLDGIKEEEEYDEEKQIKSTDKEDKNDEDLKKDHSPLLEHISETEENETDENDKSENKMIPILEIGIESENRINDKENVNVIENLLEGEESTETVDVTSESTNEVKETTITDRSTDSLSLDPARPIVPELNLDSLRDITISSFKMNDADETVSLTEPTLSGKDKIDLEENVLSKEDENVDNDQKEDDTSPMEMISMDEKLMERDYGKDKIDLEENVLSKEDENVDNDQKEDDTSPMEMISMDEKLMEKDYGKDKIDLEENVLSKEDENVDNDQKEDDTSPMEMISMDEKLMGRDYGKDKIDLEENVLSKEDENVDNDQKEDDTSPMEMISMDEKLMGRDYGKDKIDLEENVLSKEDENVDNDQKEDDTSPMEMISMDEKLMERDYGKDKIDLEENVLSKEDENVDNDQKEDDTSPMEMISMDEKLMERNASLIHLENEDISKEERSEKIIKNEEEQLVVPNETEIQSTLIETVEQCDTMKSGDFSPLSPVGYLEIEQNTTDLDTEEEIAKELIEIDRAENRYLSQDTPIVSKDHLEDESNEILNSKCTIEDREVLTILEEENIKSMNEKQDDNDSSRKNNISNTSEDNLKEIRNLKEEEENISERIESTRSNDNEMKNDRSNESSENKVKSDSSVTASEENETKEFDTKLTEKKEYHIYVTDLKATGSQEEEDSSKSSSMTFHSAVTKIQAGIRGFLTRKKLQKNYPYGSTLDSIPSIQESIAEEPLVTDLQSVSEEMADSLIKSALSSAMISENMTTVKEKGKLPLTETVSMPTKHRQCLRREDAIQRNTLSMENAFTSCGVQHTGEFHDCLPLPVLESTEMTKSNVLSENKDKDETMEEELIDQNKFEKCNKEENIPESFTDLILESNEHNNDDIIENIDRTSSSFEKDLNNLFGGLHPKDLAKFLVSQVNAPIVLGLVDIVPNSVQGTNPNVIFERNTNLNVNDDGTGSFKDDSTLQNRYLNFITSVEDNEPSHVMETLKEHKDHSTEHSIQSLREPLALPGTPEGVLIEELSSLDSTTMSKLQDVSFNPINLESTTMDRESIEKSIDSENSMEVLDKSDDVDIQTPITMKREENIIRDDLSIVKESVTPTCTKTLTMFDESDERIEISISSKEDEIENKVKDNADQLVIIDENIDDTNGKTIEQSTSISENEEIENNKNKKDNSNDEDENKETSSDDQDKNKETILSDEDENKETSSDDKDENKETSSDEKMKNLDNSESKESKLSNESMKVCLDDSVEKSDDKET